MMMMILVAHSPPLLTLQMRKCDAGCCSKSARVKFPPGASSETKARLLGVVLLSYFGGVRDDGE